MPPRTLVVANDQAGLDKLLDSLSGVASYTETVECLGFPEALELLPGDFALVILPLLTEEQGPDPLWPGCYNQHCHEVIEHGCAQLIAKLAVILRLPYRVVSDSQANLVRQLIPKSEPLVSSRNLAESVRSALGL